MFRHVIFFYLNSISNYKNEEEYEEVRKSKFINGDIDVLIVVDKLLTGFDAPNTDEPQKSVFEGKIAVKPDIEPASRHEEIAIGSGSTNKEEVKVERDKGNPSIPSWLSNRFK